MLTQDLGTFQEGLHHNVVGQSCFRWGHLMHSSSVFVLFVSPVHSGLVATFVELICFSGCLRFVLLVAATVGVALIVLLVALL
jgi:hypothetical protein